VITISSIAGSNWGQAPRGAGLGGASTHFIQTFKKRVFQQKCGPTMLKNAYFWKKNKIEKLPQRQGIRPKNPRWLPAAGDSAPRSPRCYSHLL